MSAPDDLTQTWTVRTPTRAKRMRDRGNIAVACAAVLAAGLTAVITGAGRWMAWMALPTAAVAILAAGTIVCYALAGWLDRVPGDSPQVTHPTLAPSEVRV